MAASDDREDVALSSSELDDVLSSAGLVEDKPEIPADDLELYGVWVKVKPQVVAAQAPTTPELADLESAEGGDSAELTDDEQDLLAELETGTPQDVETADLGGETELSMPEMPSLIPDDTLTISDEPEPGALDDLSLEEPGGPTLDSEVAALDAELGSLPGEPVHTASGLPSLEEEEIHLESPGGTEEQMPALELEDELVLDEPSGISLDTDIDLEAAAAGAESQEESLPALDEDIILEEPGSSGAMDDLTMEEPARPRTGGVAELEAADAFEPETPLGVTEGDMGGIDLETEMVPEARPASASRPAPARADAASQILEKIEQELHAIRREISDLKGELTVLRKERDDLGVSSKEAEETEVAGFFGGDEDETIALTGDELDNILSTADITEAPQAPVPPAAAEEIDLGEADAPMAPDVLSEDILERPEADLDLTEADGATAGEISIPEEELVDSSSDDTIRDESSLLGGEGLEGLDLGVDLSLDSGGVGDEIIVETEEADEGVSVDLAADLAAEAEAAVAEQRSETAAMPADDFVLDTEVSLPAAADLDLGADLSSEMGDDLGVDLGGGESPELDIELELDADTPTEAPMPEPDMDLILDEEPAPAPVRKLEPRAETPEATEGAAKPVPDDLRDEIKSVLAYLDQLLEALPDEKIEEFAKSEYFGVYKKLFVELGLED